ncbi:MAG: hypothetical protein CM15mP65_12000 [Crocinitomicaceae bacterium]|nr:MAG: hypothetical protein CM15mP65_12000 [Crocinitomicaceae bacterium]
MDIKRANFSGSWNNKLSYWDLYGNPPWRFSLFLLEGKVSDTYIPIISFAILFTTIVVLGILLSKVIEKMLAFIQLKQLNKIGGIVFGVLKVLLFVGWNILF